MASITREWRDSILGEWLDLAGYLRQRKVMLQDPRLFWETGRDAGLISPVKFYLRGTLAVIGVIVLLGWVTTHFLDLPDSPVQRTIHELSQKLENVKDKDLQAS